MTQIVTISANAAALNMEALKTPRRISVKHRVQDVKADADNNLQRAENLDKTDALDAMAPASALALDLLASGHQPQQQASMRQVEAAYRDIEDQARRS